MVTDLVAFQTRCQRYVQRKQVPAEIREDLVSTMLVEVLEHPATHFNVELLYMHALDKVDPRTAHRACCTCGPGHSPCAACAAWQDGRQSRRLRYHELHSALDAPLTRNAPATRLEALPGARPPDASLTDYANTLPTAGRTRAIRLLHELYGYTQKEVGYLFGVTEARINQILHAAQAEAQAPPRVEAAGPFELAIRWIRF